MAVTCWIRTMSPQRDFNDDLLITVNDGLPAGFSCIPTRYRESEQGHQLINNN